MSKRSLILTSVVGVLLTALVVLGAVSLLRGPEPAEQASEPEAPPAEVAERPDCPSDGVGGIALPCLGGTEGTGDGAVVLANVWAWWCGPCRDELPYLEEYAQSHPEVSVVGVHADANAANGAAFLNDVDVNLPSYQDSDNTFAGTLGLPGVVPITALFVDGEMVEYFPRTFESAEDIDAAVSEALSAGQEGS